MFIKHVLSALFTTFLTIAALPVAAAPADYHFEIVEKTIHAGEKVPLHVRLLKTATGMVVSRTTMAEPKLIMIMPGMDDMAGHATKMISDTVGAYRIAADVVAPGEWVLDLTAQVPDEKEPVHGSLKFQVVK